MSKLLQNPYILITFLIGIFFFPILFQDQVFYYGDILTTTLPYKEFVIRSIVSGIFPLWNPYIHTGYPQFADISLGNYYPFYFLLFFSKTVKSISFLVVLHFLIAALSTYKLGKLFNFSKTGAIAASIIFGFSGVLVNYIGDLSRLFVVCYYPLFFYTLLKAFKKKSPTWLILSSFILSLQIFAGHIQYTFIELLGSLIFVFFKDRKINFKFQLFSIILVTILSSLLSAVVLLPALEIFPLTTRSEIYKNISIYENFSLNPLSIIHFFIAHFWGVKNLGYAWGTKDTSLIGYLGFLPLIIIFLSSRKIIQNRNMQLLLIGSFVALVISFGTYLPFFRLFVDIIPIFKIFRNPMAFLSLYSLFMGLLAGFSLDVLEVKKATRRIFLICFLIGFLLSASFYLLLPFFKAVPYKIVLLLAKLINRNLSTFHTIQVDYIIARFITLNIVTISILTFLSFLFKQKKIIVFIIFLDLLIFTKSNFWTIQANYFEKENPIAQFLKENLGPYRYFSISEAVPFSGMHNYFGNLAFQPPFAKEGKRLDKEELENWFLHEFNLIPPNFSMYWGIPTINGTTTFILKDYNSFFQDDDNFSQLYEEAGQYNPYVKKVSEDVTLTNIDLSHVDFNEEIFDKLVVKYIVSDRKLNLYHHQIVFENEGISVYENKKARPRVLLINNNEDKIIEKPTIIKENANMIQIKTKAKGKLILKDLYYPGWRVYIENREIPIIPYENIFRMVEVDEEDTMITFKFKPQSFRYGVSISIATFLLTLFSLKLPFFRKYV